MDIGTSNSLFFVEYEVLRNIFKFSCWFVRNHVNKSCEIIYRAVDQTDQTCAMNNQVTWNMHRMIMNSSNDLMSDTVIVFIPLPAQASSKIYCFTAIGNTPLFTIAVEGTFKTGIDSILGYS